MGCDQSKSKDIADSRRARTAPSGPDADDSWPKRPTQSAPIGVTVSRDNNNASILSTSYTDQRINEEDLFSKIIRQTEDNLINTSDVLEVLPRHDVQERSEGYRGLVSNGKIEDQLLPSASSNALELLGSGPVPASDVTLMEGVCEEVRVAVASFTVQDVGDVVVHLPPIP